jgi:hypothetical protein
MKNTEIELLPCPFCGASAKFGYREESFGYYPAKSWVFCTKCKAQIPDVDHPNPFSSEWKNLPGEACEEFAKKTVADHWNKRFTQDVEYD